MKKKNWAQYETTYCTGIQHAFYKPKRKTQIIGAKYGVQSLPNIFYILHINALEFCKKCS